MVLWNQGTNSEIIEALAAMDKATIADKLGVSEWDADLFLCEVARAKEREQEIIRKKEQAWMDIATKAVKFLIDHPRKAFLPSEIAFAISTNNNIIPTVKVSRALMRYSDKVTFEGYDPLNIRITWVGKKKFFSYGRSVCLDNLGYLRKRMETRGW